MSDGGKYKQASFLLNDVCISKYSLFVWSVPLVLFCGGCCVELNISTRPGAGGSNSSLPNTPGGDTGSATSVLSWAVSFEKLLEDPCGVHHFTVSNVFHVGVVGLYVLRCLCSHRIFLRRPSWSPRWARRTFYSGRPVRSSSRSLLRLWMRWGGPSLQESVDHPGTSRFSSDLLKLLRRKHA